MRADCWGIWATTEIVPDGFWTSLELEGVFGVEAAVVFRTMDDAEHVARELKRVRYSAPGDRLEVKPFDWADQAKEEGRTP